MPCRAGEFGEKGGVVAAAADLQDPVAGLDVEQVQHHGDHLWW
jgi:hypothetical protein